MKKKIIILIILALLLVTVVGCSLGDSQDENLRNMGFPSLSAVPDGFSPVNAKTIDAGNWCEISYENNIGDFLSLDCYESGTFDTAFPAGYAKSTDKINVKDKEATVYKDLSDNDKRIIIIAWEDENNNSLCLLGGNVSIDQMVQAAESIKYDRKKVVTEADNNEITASPKERGTIVEADLKKYSDVLEQATKPLFNLCMEGDKAILKFELESFYKSFEFAAVDDLSVEVFDYEYVMKAKDNVKLLGGMCRDENKDIRGFYGFFGQIAAVSRDGKLIKAVLVTNMDVNLEPEDADDEEASEWIKDKVMTAVKSPAYLMRNRLKN